MKDPRINAPSLSPEKRKLVENLGWRLESDWGQEVWDGSKRLSCEPTMAQAVDVALKKENIAG